MLRIAIIVLAPVALRAALVPLLDDFDADGYSRVLIARQLAEAWQAGNFDWGLLYIPAWMPAWHLLCAAVQIVIPEPYYVPKLLSAIFGGLSPALVYLLAGRLGGDQRSGWVAWAIAALLPLPLLYSATAMSEAFGGFWILLATYALLRCQPDRQGFHARTPRREEERKGEGGTFRGGWFVVSALAMLPVALTRYESWILLPVLTLLAVWQRRARPAVLVASTGLMALGPLIWLAINHGATGNPLSFLSGHSSYIAHLFEFYPRLADRGPVGLARHLGSIVAASSLTLTALGLYGMARIRSRQMTALSAIVFAQLILMFLLWALHLQVGYMRHYMTVGLLLAAAAPLSLRLLQRRRLLAGLLVIEMAVLGLVHSRRAAWSSRLHEAAEFVGDRPGLIYCDEPGVEVLSRLPSSRFVDSHGMARTPSGALDFMRRQDVRWIVYSDTDYSPLPELFPPLRTGQDAPPFRLVFTPPSNLPNLPAIRVFKFEPEGNQR